MTGDLGSGGPEAPSAQAGTARRRRRRGPRLGWPRSLWGRTFVVLAVGMLLVALANQTVNFFDRGSGVYRLAAQQTALRIAEASRVLNRLDPAQREVVVQELTTGRFNVSLRTVPFDVGEGLVQHDRYEQALSGLIGLYLRAEWKRSVQIVQLGGKRRPLNYEVVDASALEQWIARHFYFLQPGTLSVVAQVRLEDGTTALFLARMPQEPLSRLESLVPRLLLNVGLIMVLAAIALATITRSLRRLAQAAQAVGDDPDGRAIDPKGPSEVRSVILAFNTMRQRLRDQLDERARMLAAISHDLRTPITRMRLRVEMLDDAALRARFAKDLDEMEALTGSTLEFMRTLGARPERRPVDLNALLDSLREDAQAAGRPILIEGQATGPVLAHPLALRRCLDNLVDNAQRYGGNARLAVQQTTQVLQISVRDEGPGIPPQDLARVFEPFVRLEASRNRESGGTGLGLSIARNLARWHGGDIELRNHPGGGLEALLTLPLSAASAASVASSSTGA